jgi:hypothetical protein
MPNIIALDFKPLRKGTLLGFATVEIRELGLRVRDIAIHRSSGSCSAAMPAKAMIDAQGNLIHDPERGRISYTAIFEFADASARGVFSQAVIDAVAQFNPAIFTTPASETADD